MARQRKNTDENSHFTADSQPIPAQIALAAPPVYTRAPGATTEKIDRSLISLHADHLHVNENFKAVKAKRIRRNGRSHAQASVHIPTFQRIAQNTKTGQAASPLSTPGALRRQKSAPIRVRSYKYALAVLYAPPRPPR